METPQQANPLEDPSMANPGHQSITKKQKTRLSLQLTGDFANPNAFQNPSESEAPTRTSWLLNHGLNKSNSSSKSIGSTSSEVTIMVESEIYMDAEDIVDSSLSTKEKIAKVTKLFIRAASNGDVAQVREFLNDYEKWVDIDTQDGDGTTALVYASCFGHSDVAYLLLEHNAKPDERDKHGWTPLMWAVSNGHEQVARILIEGGANRDARSNKGRTIKDLVGRNGSPEIARLLDYEPAPSDRDTAYSDSEAYANSDRDDSFASDTETVNGFFGRFSTSPSQSPIPGHRSQSSLSQLSDISTLSVDELGLFEDEDDDIFFDWDKCLLDQMFVFNETETDYILDIALAKLKPAKASSQKPIAANIIFLCARYAHYFNSQDMVEKFLRAAIEKIVVVVQKSSSDTNLISYWIANCTQLLYYLKRDQGLVTSTFETQCQLSELIHEISILFVREVERRLVPLISDAILDHSSMEGLNVRFENALTSFIKPRRVNSSLLKSERIVTPTSATSNPSPLSTVYPAIGSSPTPTIALPPVLPNINTALKSPTRMKPQHSSSWSPPAPPRRGSITQLLQPRIFSRKWPHKVTPKTLTSILSSTIFVLQSYSVHNEIIVQIFSQLFHFLGAELFNRILTDKNYCSRSKALMIRMNISVIEEWVREKNREFPKSKGTVLVDKLKPLVQLLQFLQVATSERELSGFSDTLKSFDSFSLVQARRAMINYKWEVEEEEWPEEVEEYVFHMIESLRIVQRDRLEAKSNLVARSRKKSNEMMTNRMAKSVSGPTPAKRNVSLDLSLEEVEAEVDEADILGELLDPTLLLPFQVPVLLGGNTTDPNSNLTDDSWLGSSFVPNIPEEVMKLLDKKSESHDTIAPVDKIMKAELSPPPQMTKTTSVGAAVAGLKTIGRGFGAAVGASLGAVDAAINAVIPISPLPDNNPTPPWALSAKSPISPLSNGVPSSSIVEIAARSDRRASIIGGPSSSMVESAARSDRRASIIDRRGSIILERRPSALLSRPFSITPDDGSKALPPSFAYSSSNENESSSSELSSLESDSDS
ncbi:hypothetical protein HK096_000481 [Nowakowskiella sp. JEL0078]|nr:hypothetical protein HK096_000481 [Nowakowskiella sp. JEL0078]